MPTPYAEYVGGRDPVDVLRESLAHYRDTVAARPESTWERPWAPGKWTARQILVHVMQWEMILGVRLRCGLAVPGYVVQPIDQDLLMGEAGAIGHALAFDTFVALRRTNIALAASMSPEDRRRAFQHPERGAIDVEDILVTLAGHGVHHLPQLQTIG